MVPAEGGGQARLTWSEAYDGEADWSPDGSRIAFVRGAQVTMASG